MRASSGNWTEDVAGTVRPRRFRRAVAVDIILIALLATLAIANLVCGSVAIDPGDIVSLLAAGPDSSTASRILWEIRLPRIMVAILLGGALSLSGFLLQTFFANPIADPFVLGISSGARLAVATTMIVVLGSNGIMSPGMSVGAAFIGSLATMGFVLILARTVRSIGVLIVVGVMVGYMCSAATSFLIAFADEQDIVNLQNWAQGSFAGSNWADATVLVAIVTVATVSVFALSKPLGAYQLGETYARTVGVNIVGLRLYIVLVSSLLSACVVAFAGPISFVGIAAPHLAKIAVKTSKPLHVTPACFLCGSVFCCGCDLVARLLFSPVELSVSAVTAVLGAPIVIGLLLRRRGRSR